MHKFIPCKYISKCLTLGKMETETKITKPKGIMPQWLSDERRFNEITSAMKRFSEANRNIPTAWITELEQIFTRSQERGKK